MKNNILACIFILLTVVLCAGCNNENSQTYQEDSLKNVETRTRLEKEMEEAGEADMKEMIQDSIKRREAETSRNEDSAKKR